MRIQICSIHVQNTLGATSALILLVNSRRGESYYWLIPSSVHFFVALVTSRRRQVLIYTVCIQNVSEVDQCAFKIWWELLYFVLYRNLDQHNRPS